MKISSVNLYTYKNETRNNVKFCGLQTIETPSLFVFDLDGTLASATQNQIGMFFQSAKNCNADIIYATGRTYKEFLNLQKELKNKGVSLPFPDYLISNNGNFLHENIDGMLIQSNAYQEELQNSTHYDREIVISTIKEFSKKDEYRYKEDELAQLSNLEEIKASDPEFCNSKISYYEWNPSENMAEYFIAHDVDYEKLTKELCEALSEKGIKVKFQKNYYSKHVTDACRKDILLQANPLRRHKNGGMTALFISPGDKSTGIEYIRKHKNVKYNDILIAGNDDNDIPMAKLSKKGTKFICLNDASEHLINYCRQFKDNILISLKNGADAIQDGIEYFCTGLKK